MRDAIIEDVRSKGVNIHLLGAVFAVFLQGSVTATIALLVSTIASSTLFTVIVSTAILFLGHIQQAAREFYFEMAELSLRAEGVIAFLLSVFFPDYQIFNIYDGVIAGEPLTMALMGNLTGLAFSYVFIYLVAAWLIFAKKEL